MQDVLTPARIQRLNHAEVLERAEALVPMLAERARETELLRRIPDETVHDLRQAGLLRLANPERFGGHGLDYDTVLEVTAVLGRACGSTAWCYSVWSSHNWMLGMYPLQAQQEYFGDSPDVLSSSSFAPGTRPLELASGGYLIQGTWGFSSGSDAAQWVMLGANHPTQGPGLCVIPRSDYRIEDNWHVMGLSGTGSKDVVVAEAFVPEYRTHAYLDAFLLKNPGAAVNDGPLYRLPFGLVFANALTASAVGVALGALATFREQSRTRVNVRDNTRVAEDPFIHLRLADSAAEVDAARDRILSNFAEMMRLVSAGNEIPLTQRARYRWDGAKAVDWSLRSVDRLFEASGGRGIFLDNPIQRAWRDVHAMRAHVANNPEKIAPVFGRSEFGLPPVDIRF